MGRKLHDTVVIITGASSGIGRATALAFAKQRATVVLAARREGVLRGLAAECERAGAAAALVVPTDVTNKAAVEALAAAAVRRFGRFHVWVNNASVHLFGRLEDHPEAETRRVLETNVLGYTFGAQAAVRHFRLHGDGTLINVASAVAEVPQPYAAAYVMSKAAVRGLANSVRMELWLDGARDIHVCSVLPGPVDTPLFVHGANFSGRAIKAPPPVYAPERIAKAIVGLARKPKGEVTVGAQIKIMAGLHRVAPQPVQASMAKLVDTAHVVRGEPGPHDHRGNLFEPMAEGDTVRGGWKARRGSKAVGIAALSVPVIAALAWLRRRG
jgi:short-subunit dehydrogenase